MPQIGKPVRVRVLCFWIPLDARVCSIRAPWASGLESTSLVPEWALLLDPQVREVGSVTLRALPRVLRNVGPKPCGEAAGGHNHDLSFSFIYIHMFLSLSLSLSLSRPLALSLSLSLSPPPWATDARGICLHPLLGVAWPAASQNANEFLGSLEYFGDC